MGLTIRPKRSTTAGAVPSGLLAFEIAINSTDKKIYVGSADGLSSVLIASLALSDHVGTTDNLTQGSTNKFYADSLARAAISSTATGLTYTSSTGVISFTSGYAIPTTASQTNWDAAYTQRLQWDGGATNLVAATGRTSLGSTTVGSNLFTLTNPSAITFPRFNADNTVSALDAATFRTAIGAGTAGTTGTVTSIATTSPITGGTITGTGTIGINAASANTASYVVQRDASGDFSAGKITLGGSGSSTSAQLTFSGSTNNWIDLGTNGYATPAFTTRSVGTKVVFYKDLGASSTDYAAGIEMNALWFSIPAATSDRAFKFYGGTTSIASLTGNGNFSANKKITGETLSSTVAIGTAPITVTSTTQVANLNASLLEGYSTATANTVSTIVRRDASGNFAAGTITAALTGNASTATNIAGGGAGQVPYNTGSGATSFLAAGTAGQVLQSNGTSAPSWGTVSAGSSIPSGSMQMYAGSVTQSASSGVVTTNAPSGWLLANGDIVSRTTYSALFTAIGTTYGAGNGSTTFALPDMRSRVPVGVGTGSGLTARTLGGTVGQENITIGATNLPSHSHTFSPTGTLNTESSHYHASANAGWHAHASNNLALLYVGSGGGANLNAGTTWQAYNFNATMQGNGDHNHGNTNVNSGHTHTFTPTAGQTTGNGPGSGASLTNMQPSIGVNYIIKT